MGVGKYTGGAGKVIPAVEFFTRRYVNEPEGFFIPIMKGTDGGLVEDVHWFLFPCTCPCFQHLLLTTVGKVGK